MGCGSSKGEALPQPKPVPKKLEAYRVERHPTNDAIPGVTYRRASSIQRHIDAAPPIPPGLKDKKNNNRYPKKYNNKEKVPKTNAEIQLFHVDTSLTLYEYPSKTFPYDKQNYKGGIYGMTAEQSRREKGHTRTITDRNKTIKGVIYHPQGDPKGFNRAQEIYS
ncbi:hypothetical protein GE09DRAFT_194913 [Coniochaeta sp. 2T2.1]|nr:hypothetical protein GE09DRAFT_194913 [Coniochaeta sp. 2T2.1]